MTLQPTTFPPGLLDEIFADLNHMEGFIISLNDSLFTQSLIDHLITYNSPNPDSEPILGTLLSLSYRLVSFKDSTIKAIATALPNLISLVFNECTISPTQITQFTTATNLSKLQLLRLYRTRFGREGIAALLASDGFPNVVPQRGKTYPRPTIRFRDIYSGQG